MHQTCNFYELIKFSALQVTSKDSFLGMELLEYRVQVEGLSGGKISTSIEHNPIFEQEGTQVVYDEY